MLFYYFCPPVLFCDNRVRRPKIGNQTVAMLIDSVNRPEFLAEPQ